jgi:hypothetical protein
MDFLQKLRAIWEFSAKAKGDLGKDKPCAAGTSDCNCADICNSRRFGGSLGASAGYADVVS